MTAVTSLIAPAEQRVQRLFRQFSHEDRIVAQRARNIAIFIAVVVVAYHYSLSTLFRSVQSDTPLAYLGLVPVMALGLGAVLARPSPDEPPIHDRQLDYIVGVPLLLGSLAINIIGPVRLSSLFWIWRVDLLAFPMFVAGAIALLFGVRALWRGRIPVAFLFLAWPLPYTSFLANQLQGFTNVTVAAVKIGLGAIPVATAAPGSDGTLFTIHHGGTTFPVSVASACSGVNGVVGYALVGLAFLALVHGGLVRKTLWMGMGLALVWILNVGRILVIFAAGHAWGEQVAINLLHPVLGLLTFSLGVVVMLVLMPRFGLTFRVGPPRSKSKGPTNGNAPSNGARSAQGTPVINWAPSSSDGPGNDGSSSAGASSGRNGCLPGNGGSASGPSSSSNGGSSGGNDGPPTRGPADDPSSENGGSRPRPPAVPRTKIAVIIVSVLAILSGIVNSSLQSFDLVSGSLGAPRLEAFLTHPSKPDGWLVYKVAQFDWARQFFGSDSTWYRYDYHWDGKSPTQFHTSSTIIADVVSTSDLTSFSNYGIEACYNFHGYTLNAINTVDLGSAVAHVVGYKNNFGSEWINVYWIDAVNTPAGTRYERINLMLINAAHSDTTARVPKPSVARSLGIQIEDALTGTAASAGPRLDHTRAFLAAFAAALVQRQRATPTATS
jgi:exosortase